MAGYAPHWTFKCNQQSKAVFAWSLETSMRLKLNYQNFPYIHYELDIWMPSPAYSSRHTPCSWRWCASGLPSTSHHSRTFGIAVCATRQWANFIQRVSVGKNHIDLIACTPHLIVDLCRKIDFQADSYRCCRPRQSYTRTLNALQRRHCKWIRRGLDT